MLSSPFTQPSRVAVGSASSSPAKSQKPTAAASNSPVTPTAPAVLSASHCLEHCRRPLLLRSSALDNRPAPPRNLGNTRALHHEFSLPALCHFLRDRRFLWLRQHARGQWKNDLILNPDVLLIHPGQPRNRLAKLADLGCIQFSTRQVLHPKALHSCMQWRHRRMFLL